jgi:protein associated with RNAse G/E
MQNGWVVIDDEDEFAAHQIELGYPPDIIAMAEATRDRIHTAILDEVAPFDGRHEPWLERLVQLGG